MTPLLQVQDLRVAFEGKEVVHGVAFHIDPGEKLALVSLDFLGLGVPPGVPSLGDLVRQGKNNLDAWWIIFPTFALLVLTMLLLTFIGDALRDAFDTRKS